MASPPHSLRSAIFREPPAERPAKSPLRGLCVSASKNPRFWNQPRPKRNQKFRIKFARAAGNLPSATPTSQTHLHILSFVPRIIHKPPAPPNPTARCWPGCLAACPPERPQSPLCAPLRLRVEDPRFRNASTSSASFHGLFANPAPPQPNCRLLARMPRRCQPNTPQSPLLAAPQRRRTSLWNQTQPQAESRM